MANEENEQAEQPASGPQSAADIPKDRVFCTVYLFLTEDNEIAGGVDYDAEALKRLEVPALVKMNCYNAAEHMRRYARRAIDHASVEGDMLGQILEAFNFTEEDLEQSDNDSDGEQAGAASS